jgi:hypothetical protein
MRTRYRRLRGAATPTTTGVNPAGIEQLRELTELQALLLECTLAAVATTATIERAFENSGAAIGLVRERVQMLAQLLRVKPRLVKSE